MGRLESYTAARLGLDRARRDTADVSDEEVIAWLEDGKAKVH